MGDDRKIGEEARWNWEDADRKGDGASRVEDDCLKWGDEYVRMGDGSGHDMTQTTVLRSGRCAVCARPVRFGRAGQRCRACRLVAHTDCAPGLPPCAPVKALW